MRRVYSRQAHRPFIYFRLPGEKTYTFFTVPSQTDYRVANSKILRDLLPSKCLEKIKLLNIFGTGTVCAPENVPDSTVYVKGGDEGGGYDKSSRCYENMRLILEDKFPIMIFAITIVDTGFVIKSKITILDQFHVNFRSSQMVNGIFLDLLR